MNNNRIQLKKSLTGGALVMAIAASVFAQEKSFTQPGTGQPPAPPPPPKSAAPATAATTPPPEPGAAEKFFNGKLPEAIAKGKFNLNVRLRYEFVDQDGIAAITDDSHAPTIRTRFGYTTARLYGFQGMLEVENVTALGSDGNYNAAGSNGQPDKPVVADPETTELNQAWIAYSYTNLATVKAGRQRIALDNHRFVGDVGWRQNMQTFDAATLEVKPVKDLSFYYGYLWEVNRVFGDVGFPPPPSPAANNRDFESDSHLINVAYSGWKSGRFVGYAYLLDLDLDSGAATQYDNSCATYGGYFAGSAPVTEKLALGYRAEFAWQTDYADTTQDYATEYYNLELSGNVKPFAFGAGYEVLGSDSNDNAPGTRTGFKTPLATLHAFNGWADVFLNTPANGLRDLYGFAQVTLPYQVPLRFVYHKYDADSGNGDYGQEFDVVASKKFGKYWTALLKYSFYDGDDAATPALAVADVEVHKFWAQVEFNF